ncbi:MAG TPA: diacylglycerol kinase, partial [Aliiroseovarius sp.]|nr:diacylglycerol kinase [Aliiroseovarius sp.]
MWLTRPRPDGAEVLAGLTGDAARGQIVFDAGGCAACHATPKAEAEARLVLAGGKRFPSPFGTFVAPNISQDQQAGIGAWQAIDLWNALHNGTSPDG